MKKNLTITTDLLEAIHHLCTYNESKILLAAMHHTDGVLTSTQIGKMTGLTPPNNYFKVRKQLLNLDYLIIDNNGMRVNIDKILSDYAKLPS
jgi:hypothetical protein